MGWQPRSAAPSPGGQRIRPGRPPARARGGGREPRTVRTAPLGTPPAADVQSRCHAGDVSSVRLPGLCLDRERGPGRVDRQILRPCHGRGCHIRQTSASSGASACGACSSDRAPAPASPTNRGAATGAARPPAAPPGERRLGAPTSPRASGCRQAHWWHPQSAKRDGRLIPPEDPTAEPPGCALVARSGIRRRDGRVQHGVNSRRVLS
jgi:hypothetical protein